MGAEEKYCYNCKHSRHFGHSSTVCAQVCDNSFSGWETVRVETVQEAEECEDTGLKYDANKLDLSLIPGEALEILAQVYEVGAAKYDRDNWAKGFDENRLLAAGLRHYVAYRKGEETDSESGLPHLACAAWNFLTVEVLKERSKENENN